MAQHSIHIMALSITMIMMMIHNGMASLEASCTSCKHTYEETNDYKND